MLLLLIFQSTRGVYDSVIGRLRNVTVNQNLQHLGRILGASIRTFYFNRVKNESANIISLPYKSDTFFIAFFFINFWQIHVFTFNEYYFIIITPFFSTPVLNLDLPHPTTNRIRATQDVSSPEG